MRLLRSLIGLVVISTLVYVALAVPLGKKTLWQHLRAIAVSEESQDLVREVKHKAQNVLRQEAEDKDARRGAKAERGQDADAPPAPAGGVEGKNVDQLTDDERRLLRRLIREKLSAKGDAGPGA